MKIWINSCHAALEDDQARMLVGLGHEVSGLFDVGSNQRPKLAGVTDIDPPSHIHEANKTRSINVDEIGNPDVVLVHQTADFPLRAAAWARQGVQVIQMAFGQGARDQHAAMAMVGRQCPSVWLVAYALKEYRLYSELGFPADRLRMIRFAPNPQELSPHDACSWERRMDHVQQCLVPCNSIHKRGDGCNWTTVRLIRGAGVPLTLSGKDTQEVGGLGELSWAGYLDQLHTSACYLHVGTVPAPYTMTLMEAAAAGTPIVALNNGYGLADEGFAELFIADSVLEACKEITRLLTEPDHRQARHEASVRLAERYFNPATVHRQWADMLANVEARL